MGGLSFLGGYWLLVLGSFWACLGTYIIIVVFLRWGWIATYGAIVANFLILILLNQARTHNKGYLLDDKLSKEKVENAENFYIKNALDHETEEKEKKGKD